MKTEQNTPASSAALAESPDSGQSYAPRKLTFMQNAILTAKVLGTFALLGLAIWGVEVWTAAK